MEPVCPPLITGMNLAPFRSLRTTRTFQFRQRHPQATQPKKLKGIDKLEAHVQKEGKASENEKNKCTVCIERPICALYSPCNHISTCATCAVKSLKDKPSCVTCRSVVESVDVVWIQSAESSVDFEVVFWESPVAPGGPAVPTA